MPLSPAVMCDACMKLTKESESPTLCMAHFFYEQRIPAVLRPWLPTFSPTSHPVELNALESPDGTYSLFEHDHRSPFAHLKSPDHGAPNASA